MRNHLKCLVPLNYTCIYAKVIIKEGSQFTYYSLDQVMTTANQFLKCHLGTGCDYLSKIGTNPCALFAEPHLNLMTFQDTAVLDDAQVQKGETYLAHVMSHFSKFITFVELG
ncbi:unnamed protein product [Meganyctiphanes norvegica]|uniref:Uncharacterized protein n=1 Tax=Meganyctiphanes norvegica TaxID=48144 RepID=A0AAV2RSF1_MEGNR